jgi:hypothetical protein
MLGIHHIIKQHTIRSPATDRAKFHLLGFGRRSVIVTLQNPRRIAAMAIDIIYRGRVSRIAGAKAEGDNLWLGSADLTTVSGWEVKAEGACMGDVCIPIPPARASEFLRDQGNAFNLAALARHLGEPAVHDDVNGVWYFGEAAATRRAALASLQAPDFELPDLDGKMHRLSDYRGKKVLLAAWASW